jgi:hypothetical protein
MKAQSAPAGQQMTDCTSALFNDMHVESVGQQKSEGKLLPHCCRPWTPPHVCACRAKRLDAWVDVMTDVKRKKADSLDSLERFVEDRMAVDMRRIVQKLVREVCERWTNSCAKTWASNYNRVDVNRRQLRVPDSTNVKQNKTKRNKQGEETKRVEKRRKRSEYIYLLDMFIHQETHESRTLEAHSALWLSRGQPCGGPMLPE